MGINTQTVKTEHDTRGINTTFLPNSSTQTLKTGHETKGQNTNFLPSSSTQTGHEQNIIRGTNTDFLPNSSTWTQHAQNILRGINTDVGNDTQQEQCHGCQVEEQPNIQYTSEFSSKLRESDGNRPG